ncbi:MAG: nitrilase-related carbon-nitrogen hydrolase, partial [Steroidobacter sp.]
MSNTLRIALAQLNIPVGDVAGNTQRVINAAADARDRLHADLVLFPELTLTGYPPEDLLFHAGVRRQVQTGLERVRSEVKGITTVVGYPEYAEKIIYNACAVMRDGQLLLNYRKRELPNYKVFDEKRYFKPGTATGIVEVKGIRMATLICEDIWEPGAARAAKDAGAQLIVVINGSPYALNYQQRREAVVRERINDVNLPVVYLNLLGGQDELVFDGNSFVMNAQGEVVQRIAPFEEGVFAVDVDINGVIEPRMAHIEPQLSEEASVYNAL